MSKRDIIKIFIDELHSKPPKRNYGTNKKCLIIFMKSGALI